jgi:hypothetical protein
MIIHSERVAIPEMPGNGGVNGIPVWASGIITVEVDSVGLLPGHLMLMSGCVNASWDGTYIVLTASDTQFTAALAADPGAWAGGGVARPAVEFVVTPTDRVVKNMAYWVDTMGVVVDDLMIERWYYGAMVGQWNLLGLAYHERGLNDTSDRKRPPGVGLRQRGLAYPPYDTTIRVINQHITGGVIVLTVIGEELPITL